MKKVFALILGLLATVGVSAQRLSSPNTVFHEGKWMIGASASGLGIGYDNNTDEWKLDLRAKAGYLFLDDWMLTANVDYQYYGDDALRIGAGVRYYFEQNGLYLGLTGNYHSDWDDFVPELGLGYAFFLSRHITIEPEAYVGYGLGCSTLDAGVRLGFSLYF